MPLEHNIETSPTVESGGVRSRSAPAMMEVESTRLNISTEDDGFTDFDEMSCDGTATTSETKTGSLPKDLIGLMMHPIKNLPSEEDKENLQPMIRSKSMSDDKLLFIKPVGLPAYKRPQFPRSTSFSCKRDKPSSDSSGESPRCRKRSRCVSSPDEPEAKSLGMSCENVSQFPKPKPLFRSQSFDTKINKSPSIDITSLLDIDDKMLIGDRSKGYSLPLTASKHPDLKGITPDTLSAVLEGAYKDVIDECVVIDCRYPYEYLGGHIQGAINVYEREELIEKFLTHRLQMSDKRQIIVFHCEFSSKRGPNLCRFLRNKDRDIHKQSYPRLFYPEMYILEGGYKDFFVEHKLLCEPQAYLEMMADDYVKELKYFNKRSKSWSDSVTKTGLRHERQGLRY